MENRPAKPRGAFSLAHFTHHASYRAPDSYDCELRRIARTGLALWQAPELANACRHLRLGSIYRLGAAVGCANSSVVPRSNGFTHHSGYISRTRAAPVSPAISLLFAHMSDKSQRLLRVGCLLIFVAAVLLVLSRRADGPALFSGLGSTLLVGDPIAGVGCFAAALVSSRVRISVRAHPILYVAGAVAGLVVVCILVTAVAATAKARYGH
jgi:hypothetical protein